MKKVVITAAAVVLAVVMAPTQAAGDAAAGKQKAAVCGSCHGPAGISGNSLWPNLAGQSAGYIAKQLRDFKAKRRNDPTMAAMVAGLSKQDMADLGAFYASLENKAGAASNKQLAERGQRLYRGGNAKMGVSACMSCHGPNGRGIPPRYPRVSGQHADYAQKQLTAFKSSRRNNDDQTMTRIAFRMSEDEIKAVAEYMAGLH